MKTLRGSIRVFLFLVWTICMCILLFLFKFIPSIKKNILILWHRGCLVILNFNLQITGKVSSYKKTLFVANHYSYLDILALGSLLRASFIAKQEINEIPFFSWLSSLQDSILIKREDKLKILTQLKKIAAPLNASHPLVLFAEGKITENIEATPFKSSLFAIKDFVEELQIQPITISYKNKNGGPLKSNISKYYIFYEQISFFNHLWRMVCEKSQLQIILTFHSPLQELKATSRKELAQKCYDIIQQSIKKEV